MRKRSLRLVGLLTPFLMPLGLAGGCPLLGLAGCKSKGAGWEFGIQTAGVTIRYNNRADSEGNYEFTQTFDPEGAGIIHAFLGDMANEDDEDVNTTVILGEIEKLDDGGSSSGINE